MQTTDTILFLKYAVLSCEIQTYLISETEDSRSNKNEKQDEPVSELINARYDGIYISKSVQHYFCGHGWQ